MIVGGYEREAVREELEEGLKLDRVRWIECEQSHMPDWGSLGASIRSGGVSMVVVLSDFVRHAAEELKVAADGAGVPYVRVGNGCGLLGILRAIQRTVEPEGA